MCGSGTLMLATPFRGGRPVVVHLDAVEQRWRGAAGTHGLQIAPEDVDGRGHAVLGGLENLIK